LALAICLQSGWLGSRQLIHAQFDPKKVPVAAVNFLQRENLEEPPVTEPVFSTDAWGGYLIYRMYPERKVVIDDRHDLYGSGRIRTVPDFDAGRAGMAERAEDWQIRTALCLPIRRWPTCCASFRGIGGGVRGQSGGGVCEA
jgi:hypothetical protein